MNVIVKCLAQVVVFLFSLYIIFFDDRYGITLCRYYRAFHYHPLIRF